MSENDSLYSMLEAFACGFGKGFGVDSEQKDTPTLEPMTDPFEDKKVEEPVDEDDELSSEFEILTVDDENDEQRSESGSEDETVEKEIPIPSTPVVDDEDDEQSSESGSETEQSEDEDVEEEIPIPSTPVVDNEDDEQSSESGSETEQSEDKGIIKVILTPEKRELARTYLDRLKGRLLRSKLASRILMREHVSCGQARLNVAMRLLDDIPTTMSPDERKTRLLEISEYVKDIFDSLQTHSIKLVNCHGDSVCDTIQEFHENTAKIEVEVVRPPPAKNVGGGGGCSTTRRILELCAICFIFAGWCRMMYLFTLPELARMLAWLTTLALASLMI